MQIRTGLNFYNTKLHFHSTKFHWRKDSIKNQNDSNFPIDSEVRQIPQSGEIFQDLRIRERKSEYKQLKTEVIDMLRKKIKWKSQTEIQSQFSKRDANNLSTYISRMIKNRKLQREQYVSKSLRRNIQQIKINKFQSLNHPARFYKNQKSQLKNNKSKQKSTIIKNLNHSIGLFHKNVMVVQRIKERKQDSSIYNSKSFTLDLPKISLSQNNTMPLQTSIVSEKSKMFEEQIFEGWTPRLPQDQINLVNFMEPEKMSQKQKRKRTKNIISKSLQC